MEYLAIKIITAFIVAIVILITIGYIRLVQKRNRIIVETMQQMLQEFNLNIESYDSEDPDETFIKLGILLQRAVTKMEEEL